MNQADVQVADEDVWDGKQMVPVTVAECRKGRKHIAHLWLPWLSDEYTHYVGVEILRWCEGEA